MKRLVHEKMISLLLGYHLALYILRILLFHLKLKKFKYCILFWMQSISVQKLTVWIPGVCPSNFPRVVYLVTSSWWQTRQKVFENKQKENKKPTKIDSDRLLLFSNTSHQEEANKKWNLYVHSQSPFKWTGNLRIITISYVTVCCLE